MLALGSLVGALSSGCSQDDDLAVTPLRPGEALAVGAYYPLSVTDACSGDPKLPICTREEVVSIDEVTSSDEHIVVGVPAEEAPAEFEAAPGSWFFHGKDGGIATVSVTATFDDGSVRTGDLELQVATTTRATLIGLPCPRVLAGTPRSVVVELVGMQMFDTDQKLGGIVPGALTGDGLTQQFDSLTVTAYTFQAPESGEVRIRSTVVPKLDKTFTVFGPANVIDIASEREWSEPVRSSRGARESFDLVVSAEDGPICESIPIAVSALTPEVCTNPNGALTWTAEYGYVTVALVETGTCRLALSAVGAEERVFQIEFPYEATD